MNYTKGKWKADYTGSHLVSVMCPGTAEVVAICGKPKWITDRDTQIANAHLIASAPYMYEALKSLLKVYQISEDNYDHIESWKNALKAISKAEGK